MINEAYIIKTITTNLLVVMAMDILIGFPFCGEVDVD